MNVETLFHLGFIDVGQWKLSTDGNGLYYALDEASVSRNTPLMLSPNALYAFIQGDEVRYIGKTARTLRERFGGYKYPNPGQRTNHRLNGKIRDQLKAGSTVRILAFVMTMHLAQLRYSDFVINLAAGLEDSLIKAFDPPWNGRDKGEALTEEAERELVEEEAAQDQVKLSDPMPTIDRRAPPMGIAQFSIKLGEAYYNQGIVNPGVEASRELGEHDDPISVYLGSVDDPPLISRIDRRANSNGAVRLVGGNGRIARWMKQHFRYGDTVKARVLDRNSILLLARDEAASEGDATA